MQILPSLLSLVFIMSRYYRQKNRHGKIYSLTFVLIFVVYNTVLTACLVLTLYPALPFSNGDQKHVNKIHGKVFMIIIYILLQTELLRKVHRVFKSMLFSSYFLFIGSLLRVRTIGTGFIVGELGVVILGS